MLCTLSDATATLSILDDLRAARHRRKPILRTLAENASEADPAFRACLRWFDIEHGTAMLDDPVRTVAALQAQRGSFVSVGQSLLSLCANTTASLASAFDPESTRSSSRRHRATMW